MGNGKSKGSAFAARALLALLIAASIGPPDVAQARIDDLPVRARCIYVGQSATDPSKSLCIGKESFERDVCGVIDHYAAANDLPPAFFARLIWRESLFRPNAVSPKGAEGIAQFMPGTAKMRGLDNSFNVVAALGKSAEYLGELKTRYGNLGFAAAAYNAGENGLERFLEVDWLPAETRNYVLAITAYSVEDWRDNPPKTIDLTLDKNKSFLDGCVTLASTRQLREIDVIDEAEWAPWGVQLAAHFQKSIAQRLFVSAVKRLPDPIRSEKALLLRERNASFGRRIRYAARIGRDSQAEANALCATIRKNGGACLVFRN